MTSNEIAIVGAGIGGLATAIALQRAGHRPVLFEQAAQFRRIGAAINLTPNAVKALDGLGVGEALRARAYSPQFRVSRTWDSGAETSRLEMGPLAERKYGSPQLLVHRADLLSALEGALAPGVARLGARVLAVEQDALKASLTFADGSQRQFEAVIGADGIHSTVRGALLDSDPAIYSGMAAYRCIVPAEYVPHYETTSFVKWWGPSTKSQIVTFAIDGGRELFVFATRAEPEPTRESWSAECDIDDLRSAFAGYHADAQSVLAACARPLKTALFIRSPLAKWVSGHVALLGDAAHPMLPFMAQGAAMVLEDVAVLARCLELTRDLAQALTAYELARQERATRIQQASNANEWLRTGTNADWVYGYDAWTIPIAPVS